ncbi:MAG: NAD(P)H-dependent oxidoreductase [Sphingobacteriales bacterium]|nr:MAG: NAD(P)H-dependent oxidoreductase [Sphingobacteriales bacterium]
MKTILAINGSAADGAANQQLLDYLADTSKDLFRFVFPERLKTLPPFDPAQTLNEVPEAVNHFRNLIDTADGVLICTPEYVFSIPSGLKNLIEWCVATTVFSEKPVALITASASGEKAHEELQLLFRTLQARFRPDTTLLIPGIKGKLIASGTPVEDSLAERLMQLLQAFNALIESSVTGQFSSR